MLLTDILYSSHTRVAANCKVESGVRLSEMTYSE